MLKFNMIKFSPITILRRGKGKYNEYGEWEDNINPEKLERNIKVQPLKPSRLVLVPESMRSRKLLSLYCNNGDLKEPTQGTNGNVGDRFYWKDEQYEVIRVGEYFDSCIDHFEAIAARVESTPNNKEVKFD